MEKWGIWGFGAVGKSVLRYLYERDRPIAVLEKRPLTQEERILLSTYKAKLYTHRDYIRFFNDQHYIVPSPGIACSFMSQYTAEFIHELDLFFKEWHKPLIAVTVPIGITSLLQTLSH